MKANLTGFGLQRRSPPFLALLSPRAADGPLCEVACFPFQRLHAVLTSDRHVDVAEPICSASKAQPLNLMKVEAALKRFQFMLDRQYPATPSALSGHWRYPCFNENWKRSRPLVVAMRTASRRNSSVYLFAILCLLHSKHCSKETGTKPRQDHVGASAISLVACAISPCCSTTPQDQLGSGLITKR